MHSSHKLSSPTMDSFHFSSIFEKPLVVCIQSASKAKLKSTFAFFNFKLTKYFFSFFGGNVIWMYFYHCIGLYLPSFSKDLWITIGCFLMLPVTLL